MVKFISTALVALAISSVALAPFTTQAFAGEEKVAHGKPKAGGGGFHGGSTGGHSGGFGGKGAAAGVAAGIIGLAIGAIAVDAIEKANAPHGCHDEMQPLFDGYGNQVSSHRVRVCN
jgi:hypothetical protein